MRRRDREKVGLLENILLQDNMLAARKRGKAKNDVFLMNRRTTNGTYGGVRGRRVK
jgi:hypothetical protein